MGSTGGRTGAGIGGSTGGMTGTGIGGSTSTTGQHEHHGHHGHHEDIIHGGPHVTETANKLDPHISGGSTLETTSTGTSGGPHSSNIMNKADPR